MRTEQSFTSLGPEDQGSSWGHNKVLLVLGQRTRAHHEDCCIIWNLLMYSTIGIHVQNNSSYEGQYRHYHWYHSEFVVMYVETFKTAVTGQDQRGNVEITDKNFYIRISLAEQTIWLSMLDSVVVDNGIEPQWILTKQNYKIDICCFST